MIYTIGYQALAPGRLLDIAAGLDATVIDVRNVPRSRKPGFSKSALEALLGPRYEARGANSAAGGTRRRTESRALRKGAGILKTRFSYASRRPPGTVIGTTISAARTFPMRPTSTRTNFSRLAR